MALLGPWRDGSMTVWSRFHVDRHARSQEPPAAQVRRSQPPRDPLFATAKLSS
jgi:hypothetical protein